METKEVSIIVTYRGQLPEGFDHEEVEYKIQQKIEDCFRLCFPEKDDEEYDEDYHEPLFEQDRIIIAEDGYQILT